MLTMPRTWAPASLLAGLETALDLVLTAVVLLAGPDVAHGQAQDMGGDGRVGDAGGGGAHQDLDVGVLLADDVSQGVLHIVADLRGRQGQPVVAIDGTLDAAGPGKGLPGPEKDGLDLQKILGNDGLDVFHRISSFAAQPQLIHSSLFTIHCLLAGG